MEDTLGTAAADGMLPWEPNRRQVTEPTEDHPVEAEPPPDESHEPWAPPIRAAWEFHGFTTPVQEFLATLRDCRKRLGDLQQKYWHELRGSLDGKTYERMLQADRTELIETFIKEIKKSGPEFQIFRLNHARSKKNRADQSSLEERAKELSVEGKKAGHEYERLKARAKRMVDAHARGERLVAPD
ncbi:MAG: hypothetical protein Q9213_005862 [Squamulea squamosa]